MKRFLVSIMRTIGSDLVLRWSAIGFVISIIASLTIDGELDWKGAFIVLCIPPVISMFFTVAGHAFIDGVLTHIRDNKTRDGQTIALIAAASMLGLDSHADAIEKMKKENGNG